MNDSSSSFLGKFLSFIDKSYTGIVDILETRSRQKGLWLFVYILCFALILVLNKLTPMIADDFAYLYIFGEKEQVSNLSELIRSQVTHYKLWGGRSVVHFIAQALLQMPSFLIDILNSLVYILFTSLIYLHIKGNDKRHSLALFILINLAIWFIIPMFGDTILWVTGSANYLWGTTIVLLFLLPFRLYNGEERGLGKRIIYSVLMLLFGVVAGWTNENSVVGLIVIIFLFFIFYHYQRWSIPVEYIIGFVGVLLGFVMMIKAPGNFVRGGDAIEVSLFIILYRAFSYTQTLFSDYGLLIILYITLIILYNRFTEGKNKSDLSVSFIYALGAVAAIYAMIFSPQFPARAWFGLIAFFIIAVGNMLYRLNYNETFLRKLINSLIMVGIVMFMFTFYSAIKDVYRINQIDKERELIAKEAREAGAEKCYFKIFKPLTKYVHGEERETNLLLSYYYGIYVEYEKE